MMSQFYYEDNIHQNKKNQRIIHKNGKGKGKRRNSLTHPSVRSILQADEEAFKSFLSFPIPDASSSRIVRKSLWPNILWGAVLWGFPF